MTIFYIYEKNYFHFIICWTYLFFSNSCKKDDSKKNDCLPTATTYRQIINKPATIRQHPGGTFYIVEQGTIDGQLIPCNLTADFQIDNLLVTISGDVKATVQVDLVLVVKKIL